MNPQIKLIERKPYAKILRDLQDRNIIKVITGLRRAGKSTLLEMHADTLRRADTTTPIHFLNFEDPDVFSIGDWKAIYDHIKVRLIPDRMNYVFLDEVQNIPTFERLVDGLFIKKNVDLYVTGSNAHLLSGELATLLTGRYIETEILPFSFAEFIEATNYTRYPDTTSLRTNTLERKTRFPKLSDFESFRKVKIPGVWTQEDIQNAPLLRFLQGGGIPFAVNENEHSPESAREFLRGVITTILEKDIFKRYRVLDKPAFSKILDFVADSIGSHVSPNNIATTLKSNGVPIENKTVTQYLSHLFSTYFIIRAPRYDVRGKNLLRTLDKYYLSDTGFRAARLRKKDGEDLGHLLENAVFLELRRRHRDVFVGKWKDKEIDFVTIGHDGEIAYYQVAWTTQNPATLERELAPLRAIRDSNPKFLLTADLDFNPVYDGIRKLNVTDWLLNSNP